jgi:hypothetical protein
VLARSEQRGAGGQDDETGHELRKGHAGDGVPKGEAHLLRDRVMRLEQAAEHHGHFFGSVGRSRDTGEFGGMPRIADRDATQALDSLRKQVDELELLTGVLVEEQVELVEGRPGDQPVVLLVQGIEDGRVGQNAVQELDTLRAGFRRKSDRHEAERAERLDLLAVLAEMRLR